MTTECLNNSVIEELQSVKDFINESRSNSDIVTFKLKDLNFNNGIVFANESLMSQKALAKICRTMNVYDKFLDYQKKMSLDDWSLIQKKLSDLNSDIQFYGRRADTMQDSSVIMKVFSRQELENDNAEIAFETYIDFVVDALQKTEYQFESKLINFDEINSNLQINLLDRTNNIDIFGHGDDIWRKGVDLSFDLLQYQGAPFFERLVCTNGMTAGIYGHTTNIERASFDYNKIKKQIDKLMIKKLSGKDEILMAQGRRLAENDASVSEFLDFKRIFDNINIDDKYTNLIENLFDPTDIIKAYGVDPANRSKKWQQTATSGRNAYDLLNSMTYIASHATDKEIDMDWSDAKNLSLASAKFMFKPQLDLADVAQPAKFNVKSLYSDFVNN